MGVVIGVQLVLVLNAVVGLLFPHLGLGCQLGCRLAHDRARCFNYGILLGAGTAALVTVLGVAGAP